MILHIDMDAFYASVEEREKPELRGKPLVVARTAEERGVVAAANYASRKFGIHSAMPTVAALRLCPQLIVLPPRGKLYMEVSAKIHEIFNRYTPLVESLSLDEAFLDPSGSERLHGNAEQIGAAIKRDIHAELKLIASVGVAPNKFLAKLASDHDKPDGFTVIREYAVQSFLDPLPVERIWGVGKAVKAQLNCASIHTILQLRQSPVAYLQAKFGEYGKKLWQLAHGIDDRKVTVGGGAKSISHETTFPTDITSLQTLHGIALDLTERVCYRLRGSNLYGKTVQLKIRFEDFSTVLRARSLVAPSNTTNDIWQLANILLQGELTDGKFSVRLLGVGVTNLIHAQGYQSDLFQAEERPKKQALDELTDAIHDRYGKAVIRRGRSLLS